MRKVFVAVLSLWLSCQCWSASRVNLDSLYLVLDAAIDSSDIYLQRENEHIAQLKAALWSADNDELRFSRSRSVYQEYIPFENDSAIAYQYRCLDLAQRLGRDDYYAETLIALADQLTESGFYHEARVHFSRIDPATLTDSMKTVYLLGLNHLYGEMGYYSRDIRLKDEFFDQARQLFDSLQTRLDSTSVVWLQLCTIAHSNEMRLDEAMHYSELWQQKCQPESRAWATMAYYRSVIYGHMGDGDMQRNWLVRSALVDIRNAIMDQGSLWSLAETLTSNDEERDRAHRYIDFSWQCLSRFSTHMRSWLVAPVLTRINDEYKQRLQTANHRLVWTITLISLLAAGLLLLLSYIQKKRRQLALARNELKAANDELGLLNTQLAGKNSEMQDANEKLSQTNEQLQLAVIRMNDSNRVKDEYLGKFLSICSEYIDKLDNYRIKVNRKLKANQYSDLLRMTGSEQLKEDEVKELFANFDAVFLHLFPTFVDDFNVLLRPEERIVPPSKAELNTDLRIFALIRLGIDESSKIAEFLRYSPNSIYAYRARIKNKAAGNRNDFERQVKEIGIRGDLAPVSRAKEKT